MKPKDDSADVDDNMVAAMPLLLFGTLVRRGLDHVRPSSDDSLVYTHFQGRNHPRISHHKYILYSPLKNACRLFVCYHPALLYTLTHTYSYGGERR